MPKSLVWKLTLAFMLVAILTAGLVAVFIRLTSADRLAQLVVEQQRSSLQAELSAYYAANGSWNGLDQKWAQIFSQTLPAPQGQAASSSGQQGQSAGSAGQQNNQAPGGPPGERGPRNFFGLADVKGVVIVSVDHAYPPGSQLPADVLKTGTAITLNGKWIGTLLDPQQRPGFNTQETQFLQRTNEALLLASLGALAAALLLGILLARTLTRPLQALTEAAGRITQGQLEQQVRVGSNDEIGQLANAFNRMSQEVARVNQLRREMTADIAHDLRTPLTVISGYIESMRDGVLKPTPQRLDLIYSEIERLQNLVGDLRMLSLADAGELSLNVQAVQPRAMLDRAASLFCHQAEQQGIEIGVEAGEDLPEIQADEARFMQILSNLVTNSLRYTPSGGKVTLSAQTASGGLEICVRDTGIGIAAEELPYIFDRFHRADKSRHSENGESGLGLAIVKALVELHRGSVSVESLPGSGTAICLKFPVGMQPESPVRA